MILGRKDRELVEGLRRQVNAAVTEAMELRAERGTLERERDALRRELDAFESERSIRKIEVESLKRELGRAEARADQEREDAREARRALENERDRQQKQATGWMSLPPEAREEPEPETAEDPQERYIGALARIDEVTEGGLPAEELERRLQNFREREKSHASSE